MMSFSIMEINLKELGEMWPGQSWVTCVHTLLSQWKKGPRPFGGCKEETHDGKVRAGCHHLRDRRGQSSNDRQGQRSWQQGCPGAECAGLIRTGGCFN